MPDNFSDDEFSLDDIQIHSEELLEQPIQASPYTKPVEIIVEASAWETMHLHAREDTLREIFGIMLGEVYETETGLIIRITKAVPGRDEVTNTATSVDVGLRTWMQMEREKVKGDKLLGWYHTHPDLTVFFSQTDIFTHQAYFQQPWHVALVIDPVQQEYLFYRWQDGQIQETPAFLLEVKRAYRPYRPESSANSRTVQGIFDLMLKRESFPALAQAIDQLNSNWLNQTIQPAMLPGLLGFFATSRYFSKELEQEAVAALGQLANRRVSGEIQEVDLQRVARSRYEFGLSAIARGNWLACLLDAHTIMLIALQAGATRRIMTLPVISETRCVALNDAEQLLLLIEGHEPQLMCLPTPLSEVARNIEIARTRNLTPVQIHWHQFKVDRRIGLMVGGGNSLYLMTRTHLYNLARLPGAIPSYDCVGIFDVSQFGRDSFDVWDWAVDDSGDLYITMPEESAIWHISPERQSVEQLTFDPGWNGSARLCVQQSKATILESVNEILYQYDLKTREMVSKRPFSPAVRALQFQRVFCAPDSAYFLVSSSSIYRLT